MFGREKKKLSDAAPTGPVISMGGRLRELCGPDEEMYTALSRLLFLDPKKVVASLDSILTDAQDYEMKGNRLKAEFGYRIAGSLSLWKGDSDGVRKYFAKASSFAGEARPEYNSITKRSDQAVAIAQKYYEAPEITPQPPTAS